MHQHVLNSAKPDKLKSRICYSLLQFSVSFSGFILDMTARERYLLITADRNYTLGWWTFHHFSASARE